MPLVKFSLPNFRNPLAPPAPPFSFSWIIQGVLGVGPMPLRDADWRQLQKAGFRSRFSCCYPDESAGLPGPPTSWSEAALALPDHRQQEPMQAESLNRAIQQTRLLTETTPATYVHCWAGQERSVLVAVGIVMILKQRSLLDALMWVRRCHPPSNPLFEHLEVLETLLGA